MLSPLRNAIATDRTIEHSRLPIVIQNYGSTVKPLIDRCAACASLVLLAPLLLIIGVLVICDSRGPALFTQQRLGKHQQRFTIVKFRTMTGGNVTAFGGWLRQTGLDELPQLWNIVRGDMSWIGPRPLTESDVHRLGWQRPYYRQRWLVKPGITGLAQLYGGIGRKVTWLCDQTYVRNISLRTDLEILVASILICATGKRFVRRKLYQRRSN